MILKSYENNVIFTAHAQYKNVFKFVFYTSDTNYYGVNNDVILTAMRSIKIAFSSDP